MISIVCFKLYIVAFHQYIVAFHQHLGFPSGEAMATAGKVIKCKGPFFLVLPPFTSSFSDPAGE
jgi:hypothetical protein